MNKWEKSNINRWTPLYNHSWCYRVIKEYDNELNCMLSSNLYSSGYTYSHLKKDGAVWNSSAIDYMNGISNQKITIQQWSDAFNMFQNWMRLSFLLSICSYFENYMASIIKECIESDPGIVFGLSHSIDGILLKKKKISIKKEVIEQKIMLCTKGDWNSRIAQLKILFGTLPESLSGSISDLENIRKIRNEMGHAFGRDIERSQNYESFKASPMGKLSTKRFNKYRKLIMKIVQELDLFFMEKHIGAFEPILHYHKIYDNVKILGKGEKMIELKKSLGGQVNTLISKDQCRGIIKYYESLS